MLISLDIETKCGVGCAEKCDHAVDEFRNEVTVIGAAWGDPGSPMTAVFRTVGALASWLDEVPEPRFVGHNFKFDIKTLANKGLNLAPYWEHDTQIAAAVLTEKVSVEYLEWYGRERVRRNAQLPRGYSHRPGSQHSLKVVAPFFLGVEPFWEDPTNHDNDEYVKKDVTYTLQLHHVLNQKLKADGHYDFYAKKLMSYSRLLLDAERRGIMLDLPAMEKADEEAKARAAEAKAQLDVLWSAPYAHYMRQQQQELFDSYAEKADTAAAKLKAPTPEKTAKTRARYADLFTKAASKLEPLNLDSPTQLTWLLKEHLRLDITDFDGDETTGKAVLQKLAGQGREDIRQFLIYRKARKLTTAFFPSYREMHVDGVIHCSFNPTGTRTGRLSSSRPNLQQIERGIKKLFRARPGYKLGVFDESAIEPRLIAFYSGDLNLYDIISRGLDFHGYNTKIFFDLDCDAQAVKKLYPLEREVGKEVGLSIMYGASYRRLQESAQKRGFAWGEKECKRKVERFKEFYEGVYTFREEVINPALMAGETLTNILGRPLKIDDPSEVHMKGLNTLIQGGASDLVCESARRIASDFREQQIDGHILALEHDCIVSEFPAEEAARAQEIICRRMTDYHLPTPLGVIPLAVEGAVSDCWDK
jgi:DNA polymerase I-like protein with 3'-5' exonuclease and polymerase domains